MKSFWRIFLICCHCVIFQSRIITSNSSFGLHIVKNNKIASSNFLKNIRTKRSANLEFAKVSYLFRVLDCFFFYTCSGQLHSLMNLNVAIYIKN